MSIKRWDVDTWNTVQTCCTIIWSRHCRPWTRRCNPMQWRGANHVVGFDAHLIECNNNQPQWHTKKRSTRVGKKNRELDNNQIEGCNGCIKQEAYEFNIPRSILGDHVMGIIMGTKRGNDSILSREEDMPLWSTCMKWPTKSFQSPWQSWSWRLQWLQKRWLLFSSIRISKKA